MSFCPKIPKLGVLKFSKLGHSKLWKPLTSCADLQLKWGLKQSCNPRWELSNDMWHTTCTHVIQGDSWFLMVCHNLCFKSSNESCKPILNIYISRAFQWYKELFNLMNSDPWNLFLKIWNSIRTLTPKMGIHLGAPTLGVCGFIPSHFFTLLGVQMWLLGYTCEPHLSMPLLWSRTQG
jgi:hypothetical protein